MAAATCLPRETLKQYLVGDVEESQTEAIESHLASCPECEQTVVELEANPDTLMIGIRELAEQPILAKDKTTIEEPSVVKQALEAVRQLPETSPKHASEWPVGLVAGGHISGGHIGAYELLRPLGRGGMGMVLLARHRSLQKEVAIKLLSSLVGDKPELVTRFQREMRAAGRLQHPAIVNATDAGQERGTHYLVMEYVAGLDLSRIARLVGRLSIANACELMRQTALGLSHAHAEGIVHRDVKPSNLMLDAAGHVKILDFGLAQINLWDEPVCELTTVGQLMGTIDYMAPEQAERIGAVDYRADLYALGATLFRLLAGRAPLAASPHMTLLEKVRLLGSQTSPLLSSVREDCPPELVQLVSQLLSRDPAARPASAAHVAQALEPFCSGSQLVELLATAQAAAMAEPVADQVAESASIARPSSSRFVEAVESSKTPMKPPTRWWLWTAAAALPLMIFAGILITIETQKGQLVIQSEVADVQIKVARDGKVVDELTVHPGAQSTRLRADKYEILIDSPSDQVMVDKQQFSIKSGETVVATIKQLERSQASLPAGDSKLVPNSAELIYDGTSYLEWLRKLATDVSEEKQIESLKALYAIGERQQIEDARPVVLRVLKDQSRRRFSNSKLFSTAFGVLSKTFENQSLCDQFLASEVKNGNEEWQSFILESHRRVFGPAIPLIENAKELLVQSDAGRPRTVTAAGDYLFFCTRTFASTGDEASVSQLLDVLERSPGLTMSFWISNLFGESDIAFTETIQGTVSRVAARALKNEISADDGMRALLLINRYGDPANLDWLVPYVSQLVENPERISRFYQINQDTLSRAIIGKANSENTAIPNSEAIDVLRLAAIGDLNAEQLAVIRRLLEATMKWHPDAKEWLKQDEDRYFSQTKFHVYPVRSREAWNRLTETQRGLVVIATAASSLLPEFNNDVARPPLIEPNASLAEPLFDGRTRSQWFEILERDRDVTARRNAIWAIGTLTEASDSAQVTERLMAIVLQARANDWTNYEAIVNLVKYGGAPQNAATLDSSLIGLLIQLNGKEWFQKFLATDLLKGDDAWTARWLAALLKDLSTVQDSGATVFERIKSQEEFNTLGPNSAWLVNALLVQYIVTSEINLLPGQGVPSDEKLSDDSNRQIKAYVDGDEDVKALREKIASHESDIRKIESKELMGIFASRYKSLKQELSSWKTELAKAETTARAKAEYALQGDLHWQSGAVDKRKLDMVEQLIHLIENQPYLGKLAVLQMDAEIGTRFGWKSVAGASRSQLLVEEAIAKYAKAVLEDNDSSPEAVARAASRLASTTEVVDGWKSELLNAIRNRLAALAADHARLVTTLPIEATVGQRFVNNVNLPIPATNRFTDRGPSPRSGNNLEALARDLSRKRGIVPYIESECMALLVLMTRLNGASECEQELIAIAKATFQEFDALITQSGTRDLKLPATLWPYRTHTAAEPWNQISAEVWHGWAIHRILFELFAMENENHPQLSRALNRTVSRITFMKADRDGDRKLSSEELPLQVSDLVAESSSGIDFNEFYALTRIVEDAPKLRLDVRASSSQAVTDWAKKQIAKYDTNGDGKLTADEATKSATEKPIVKRHSFRGKNLDIAYEVVSLLLNGLPDVRLAKDENANTLILMARDSEHKLVEDTLNSLLGAGSPDSAAPDEVAK